MLANLGGVERFLHAAVRRDGRLDTDGGLRAKHAETRRASPAGVELPRSLVCELVVAGGEVRVARVEPEDGDRAGSAAQEDPPYGRSRIRI